MLCSALEKKIILSQNQIVHTNPSTLFPLPKTPNYTNFANFSRILIKLSIKVKNGEQSSYAAFNPYPHGL